MAEAVKRRFHRDRRVRLHSSGRWVCTIGRVWSSKKNKLVDKDWYFDGSEAEATEKANTKARQWELTCRHWAKTEQSAMEILGEPLPDQPRWHSNGTSAKSLLTPEQLQAIRREGPVDRAELAEAYAEFSFSELIPVYKADRRNDVHEEEVELATLSKELSQLRQIARYLPADIPAVQLRSEHFRAAKSRLLADYERRTARNYPSVAS